MTRDDGFDKADVDTGIMSDPKVLALARRLQNSVKTGAAISLYIAVDTASWKAGRRLTLDETVPGWWLEPLDDLAEALIAVNLLDSERRIPEHAWRGWFGLAATRRLDIRRKSIYGGLVSHGFSPEEANREAKARIEQDRARLGLKAQPSSSTIEGRPPSLPSLPSLPTVPARPDKDGSLKEKTKAWNDAHPNDQIPEVAK